MQDSPRTVAFLGPLATYTHQAVLKDFPKASGYEHRPCVDIKEVFDVVQAGEALFGVVPFENSTNGAVTLTLDLLRDLDGSHQEIEVCGESYVAVLHALLGRPRPDSSSERKPGVPVVDLSHIKALYTHPQAWGQCEKFLSKYLRGVERHDTSSTSKAAEMVAADGEDKAAIASLAAATVHGLEVLAEAINDTTDNRTRFLVLRRVGGQDFPAPGDGSRVWKSLVGFRINHTSPGALAEALMIFKTFGLNLTSINSRPGGVKTWQYLFFVEFEGYGGDNPVKQALADLQKVTETCRFYGSFVDRSGIVKH